MYGIFANMTGCFLVKDLDNKVKIRIIPRVVSNL